MGSGEIQGKLWGERPEDWASIQEGTAIDGYSYVLGFPELNSGPTLLDVGCGSGLFCSLAAARGAIVTGLDASAALIQQAKRRNTPVKFLTGEMESMPFADNSFDVVCGFNSFQYAGSIRSALKEVKRILTDKGRLIIMIWGDKEDCEAAAYLKAVSSLLPAVPPGTPGPFSLSENGLLSKLLKETGLKMTHKADIAGIWKYPDRQTALRGLVSSGTVARAITANGFSKVSQVVSSTILPFVQSDGRVVMNNMYRIVMASC